MAWTATVSLTAFLGTAIPSDESLSLGDPQHGEGEFTDTVSISGKARRGQAGSGALGTAGKSDGRPLCASWKAEPFFPEIKIRIALL